jgi:multicomponent Na+:H+ antiporter subunit B
LKALRIAVLVLFGALLVLAGMNLPDRGDPDARLYRDPSAAGTPNAPSYYVRNPERDADTPNMVTVILADYRGFDTMGEETVILTAGLICFLILRRERSKEKRP